MSYSYYLGWTPLVMLKFNATLRQKVVSALLGRSAVVHVQATKSVKSQTHQPQHVPTVGQHEISDC